MLCRWEGVQLLTNFKVFRYFKTLGFLHSNYRIKLNENIPKLLKLWRQIWRFPELIKDQITAREGFQLYETTG